MRSGHGPQLAPGEPKAERNSFCDVVLVGRLRASIAKLNQKIPEEAREEALRKVLRVATTSLVQTNRAFHQMLRDGVPVEYRCKDGSIAGDAVRMILPLPTSAVRARSAASAACRPVGISERSDRLPTRRGQLGAISNYGQKSKLTTRRRAIMNLALRGFESYFGSPAGAGPNTFRRNLHPDLRADYVLANGSMCSNPSGDRQSNRHNKQSNVHSTLLRHSAPD